MVAVCSTGRAYAENKIKTVCINKYLKQMRYRYNSHARMNEELTLN